MSKVLPQPVLILVVVEDVLVHHTCKHDDRSASGLNPCCGGRCSSTVLMFETVSTPMCLNPCCGGRCSSTGVRTINCNRVLAVLILVVVEDVLVQPAQPSQILTASGLNPCCGGRCSSTFH